MQNTSFLLNILRDPIWQFIGALLGLAATIWAAVWAYRKQTNHPTENQLNHLRNLSDAEKGINQHAQNYKMLEVVKQELRWLRNKHYIAFPNGTGFMNTIKDGKTFDLTQYAALRRRGRRLVE